MLIGKSVVLPSHVRTNVVASLYISLMRVMYLVGTLFFSKAHHMTFLGTLSYAPQKGKKIENFLKSIDAEYGRSCKLRKYALTYDDMHSVPNKFMIVYFVISYAYHM